MGISHLDNKLLFTFFVNGSFCFVLFCFVLFSFVLFFWFCFVLVLVFGGVKKSPGVIFEQPMYRTDIISSSEKHVRYWLFFFFFFFFLLLSDVVLLETSSSNCCNL